MTINSSKPAKSRVHFPNEQERASLTVRALYASSRDEFSTVVDLNQEAENMLQLISRQSTSITALALSSKQALAVLRQF